MWLGEQITERGIGNACRSSIYAGINRRVPARRDSDFDQMRTGQLGLIQVLILLGLMVGVIGRSSSWARAPARHRASIRQAGGRTADIAVRARHIPLKVNTSGVIPSFLASSILAFPATIAACQDRRWAEAVTNQLNLGMPLTTCCTVVRASSSLRTSTPDVFNPDDVAENMRKYGRVRSRHSSRKRTAEHIDTILARITLAGAVYLAIIAFLPPVSTQRFQGGADSFHTASGSIRCCRGSFTEGMNLHSISGARRF